MRIQYDLHELGSRFNYGGKDLLVCGKQDNREGSSSVLLARRWKRDKPDISVDFFTSDNHLFAPTVRMLRKDHGDAHDAHAEHGITELYGKHEGKPVIILGCGPSLSNALPYVKELREKHGHIVIGANSCMHAGFRHCLDYYSVLCWMTQAWWWRGFETKDLPCITSFHTPLEVIRDFPIRYYYDDTFLDVTANKPESRRKYGTLDGGMTVIYCNLHLAFKMGASRIVFVGMDLAYTNFMDHKDDPLNWEKAKGRHPFATRDIHGNTTLTDKNMTAQRDLLKGQTVFVEEEGVSVLNITDNGIFDIGGCMSPGDYLDSVRANENIVPVFQKVGG